MIGGLITLTLIALFTASLNILSSYNKSNNSKDS